MDIYIDLFLSIYICAQCRLLSGRNTKFTDYSIDNALNFAIDNVVLSCNFLSVNDKLGKITSTLRPKDCRRAVWHRQSTT